MVDLLSPTIIDVFKVGGAGAVGIYAVLWLLKRGDQLQRDNIDELKKQRDEWRTRAEEAEQDLIEHRDRLSVERRRLRECEEDKEN